MDFEYFPCEFGDGTHMIFVEPSSDVRQKVIEEFEINLERGETIILKNAANQAMIKPTDIYKLVLIDRKINLDLKINRESTVITHLK